jgi:hypothetical protein
MTEIPKRVLRIGQRLKEGEKARKYRVRAVLKWFDASRRGPNVFSALHPATSDEKRWVDGVLAQKKGLGLLTCDNS